MENKDALLKRFMSNVKKEGKCWLWLAAKNYSGRAAWGYGLKSLGTMNAHKCAWMLTRVETAPEGKWETSCEIAHCVAPDHVVIVAQRPKEAPLLMVDEKILAQDKQEQERKKQILRRMGFSEELIEYTFSGN